jgi:hypothetical protein
LGAVGVERAGDLAEALAGGVRGLNSFDHPFGNQLRAASDCWCGARLALLPTVGDEPFELVDRDKPRAPGHLDRLHVREDSPYEGGATDAQRFSGLAAGAREPLDARRRLNDCLGLSCWR